MLTLQQLNALRGISAHAPKSVTKTDINAQSAQQNAYVAASTPTPPPVAPDESQQPQAVQQPQSNYIPPVEIPCKNYADEQGHFAYIDANTGQIAHVNLETGTVYKLDDVYRLSLQHAISALSPFYHQLTWQQMLNDETVYDRFGSPVFSFAEIQAAYDKYVKPTQSFGAENITNPPKTDPFGLPIG